MPRSKLCMPGARLSQNVQNLPCQEAHPVPGMQPGRLRHRPQIPDLPSDHHSQALSCCSHFPLTQGIGVPCQCVSPRRAAFCCSPCLPLCSMLKVGLHQPSVSLQGLNFGVAFVSWTLAVVSKCHFALSFSDNQPAEAGFS